MSASDGATADAFIDLTALAEPRVVAELIPVAVIPLRAKDGSVRAYALIDAADAEWVNQWKWCLDGVGYVNRADRSTGQTRSLKLHRALLGMTVGDGLEVDHINRNRLDNRRANLRIVPRAANRQNTNSRRNSTSKHRGVSWNKKAQAWLAQMSVNGKYFRIGLFLSEDEAAQAATTARRLHMPYAVD